MTFPVTIPDLDPAGPIDPDNDYLLIRQGLNDRKATAGALSNPALGTLDMLPGQLVASDVVLVGRNNGSGYTNYIVPPQYLGFLNGVRMWFYQASAPLGWTLITNTGDRLLAVSDGSNNYNGVTSPNQSGDWQQLDHVLTAAQMPSHSHNVSTTEESGTSTSKIAKGRTFGGVTNISTQTAGANQGHNHGAIWRPAANVGILCIKDKQVGE